MTQPHEVHKPVGDPALPHEPSKRDIRRQHDAENVRDSVRRMHYHQHTVGEQAGAYMSHCHDDDGPGHVHPPRQVFPVRADGGYLEESGPSLGREAPEELRAHVTRVLLRFLSASRTPDHQVMRWSLRLFCGHVVEATAHISYETVQQAFHGSHRCAECGLDPAVIVAAKPVGRVAQPPVPVKTGPDSPRLSQLQARLKTAEAKVAALSEEIEQLEHPEP